MLVLPTESAVLIPTKWTESYGMVERHRLVSSCGRFFFRVWTGSTPYSAQISGEMASSRRSWRDRHCSSRSDEPDWMDQTGISSAADCYQRPAARPPLETAASIRHSIRYGFNHSLGAQANRLGNLNINRILTYVPIILSICVRISSKVGISFTMRSRRIAAAHKRYNPWRSWRSNADDARVNSSDPEENG